MCSLECLYRRLYNRKQRLVELLALKEKSSAHRSLRDIPDFLIEKEQELIAKAKAEIKEKKKQIYKEIKEIRDSLRI